MQKTLRHTADSWHFGPITMKIAADTAKWALYVGRTAARFKRMLPNIA